MGAQGAAVGIYAPILPHSQGAAAGICAPILPHSQGAAAGICLELRHPKAPILPLGLRHPKTPVAFMLNTDVGRFFFTSTNKHALNKLERWRATSLGVGAPATLQPFGRACFPVYTSTYIYMCTACTLTCIHIHTLRMFPCVYVNIYTAQCKLVGGY